MTTEWKEKAEAAWDEGWSEAARDYHRSREKPVPNGAASHAPGLVWRTLSNGMSAAFWVASERGYSKPEVQLWSGLGDPTAEDRQSIARGCEKLQREMLARTNSTAQPAGGHQVKPPSRPARRQPERNQKPEPPPPPDSPEDYGATTEIDDGNRPCRGLYVPRGCAHSAAARADQKPASRSWCRRHGWTVQRGENVRRDPQGRVPG